MTARENVRLAVAQRRGCAGCGISSRPPNVTWRWSEWRGHRQIPAQLSLGTQQCISLAGRSPLNRGSAADEPFSQLDSLTRYQFRTRAPRREETDKTVVMVTHDVDEGLYLADRLILMTDGPEAMVGDVLEVPFPRPRNRAAVLGRFDYQACGASDRLPGAPRPASRPSALDET